MGRGFDIKCKQSSARKEPSFGRTDAHARRKKVVLGELWSSATRAFFRRQKLALLARHWGKRAIFRAQKARIFGCSGCTHRQTDTQRTSHPGGTPPPRRKISARGRPLAPPHSNNLFALPGAEKMEYFITFPASALVWKALLGASSGHFLGSFPAPKAPPCGPRPGGTPLLGRFPA